MSRGSIIAVVVIAGLILLFNRQNTPETVTIRVLGDADVPYELNYENSAESRKATGRVPGEHTIEVLTSSSADYYAKATAKKREGADDLVSTEGDPVNVDLELVAEDGTVLDEASGESFTGYVLNTTSVQVDGEDIE